MSLREAAGLPARLDLYGRHRVHRCASATVAPPRRRTECLRLLARAQRRHDQTGGTTAAGGMGHGRHDSRHGRHRSTGGTNATGGTCPPGGTETQRLGNHVYRWHGWDRCHKRRLQCGGSGHRRSERHPLAKPGDMRPSPASIMKPRGDAADREQVGLGRAQLRHAIAVREQRPQRGLN